MWEYIVYRKYQYIFLLFHLIHEGFTVTNLRKRLDNVVAELEIIREGLNTSGRYPTCCLTVHNNGDISCEAIGPLPEKKFLKECEKCRAEMKIFLDRIRIEDT